MCPAARLTPLCPGSETIPHIEALLATEEAAPPDLSWIVRSRLSLLGMRRSLPFPHHRFKEIVMPAQQKARVVVQPNGNVNVFTSAETLYNLNATQNLLGNILGRTGCPTCCSGRQILFQQEETEFVVE